MCGFGLKYQAQLPGTSSFFWNGVAIAEPVNELAVIGFPVRKDSNDGDSSNLHQK
jgi:hypothetical protein